MSLPEKINAFFTWGRGWALPKSWCEDPHHWTWRVVDAFWIDCACCFLFRGLFVGFFLASCFWIAAAVAWILLSN